MDASRANWVVATGQIWKLYVALGGFVGALICLTVAIFSIGSAHALVGRLTGAGVVLALVTFGWLASVLRCPHCQTKLVWTMLKTRPHTSWLIDLAGLDCCPICQGSLHRNAR